MFFFLLTPRESSHGCSFKILNGRLLNWACIGTYHRRWNSIFHQHMKQRACLLSDGFWYRHYKRNTCCGPSQTARGRLEPFDVCLQFPCDDWVCQLPKPVYLCGCSVGLLAVSLFGDTWSQGERNEHLLSPMFVPVNLLNEALLSPLFYRKGKWIL